MAKNIPAGAIRFGCHIAEIHPANPDNHGAVLTTLDGSIIRAKVTLPAASAVFNLLIYTFRDF